METFREKLSEKVNDPYQVVLHKKKLPMGLLATDDEEKGGKAQRMNLLSVESFDDTFGGKRKRKRPKLSGAVSCLASLVKDAQSKTGNYRQDKDFDFKRAAGMLGHEKEIKTADSKSLRAFVIELDRVVEERSGGGREGGEKKEKKLS